MFNLTDLVQLKTKKKREDIEEILSAAIEVTKENIKNGNDVYWSGLCKFTWKKKAKTKKEAKSFEENPTLAKSDKVRVEPDEGLDCLKASSGIMRKDNGEEE